MARLFATLAYSILDFNLYNMLQVNRYQQVNGHSTSWTDFPDHFRYGMNAFSFMAFAGPDLQFSGGSVTGGTVEAVYRVDTINGRDQAVFSFTEARVSALQVIEAIRTFSNADDLALMRQALSRADLISLSDSGDYAHGFGGNDTMRGHGGADLLMGDGGSDVLQGGTGNDSLQGGAGNDRLMGGSGADTFLLRSGTTGTDVITDFQDGLDRIDITGSFQRASHADGVLITHAGGTVLIEDARLAQITAADFI